MKLTATKGFEAVCQVATAIFEKAKFSQREARAGCVTVKVKDYTAVERKLLRAGFKWGFNGNRKDIAEGRCLMKKWGRRQYGEAVQVWFNGSDDSVTIKSSFFEWDIWGITPPEWASQPRA